MDPFITLSEIAWKNKKMRLTTYWEYLFCGALMQLGTSENDAHL